MPSSPTLHRAVYFRTLSCGHGGGSVSGNTKHGSYQFSQASGRWDADASDWKECHLDLSRNLRRSSASQRSASQRWQKQIWPALRTGSTPTSMSENKLEQDLSGFADEAEYNKVKVELFTAVVDGGDLISSMALSNSMIFVQIHSQRHGFQSCSCSCLVRGQKDAYGMCFSSDRQCILICYPVIGGLGVYLMSVQELQDEWESQVENRRFHESATRAGTPSLLELSRGRRLWQWCCGEGGKECSDGNYVSDSLVEPVLLTVAEALDNKGRRKQWGRVKEGRERQQPRQRVVWWQNSGGNHFAIIAGPVSGRREANSISQNFTGIHFINLENFESWVVQLPSGSSSVSTLSIIELQVGANGDSHDEKGKTMLMQLEGKERRSEGLPPVSLKLLVATSTDPSSVHCLVLEYGVESDDDPHMGEPPPASIENQHWLRSKENSFHGEGKSWAWWSGENRRSARDHLGDILVLQPPEEELGGSLSYLSVIAPSRTEEQVQLVGLVHDGASIVYLEVSALDIVAALTPTEADHHDHFACLPLRIVSVHDMSMPATASLKWPFAHVHGGGHFQSCFVAASKNEEEDMIFVFENHSILADSPIQQQQRLSPWAFLLPDGWGPVCGIISTVDCGGMGDGNIVALVWSRTALYYMRMGGKIGKDIKTGGHAQNESDPARPGFSPVKLQQSITSPRKLTRRDENVRQDWISTLRSARALWSQGEYCHAVHQLAGAVRWAAKQPPSALIQAATKAVQFEMVDTLLSWLVDPELREQDELLQQSKLECFLEDEHILEVQIVITRLMKAGLLHHAVSYASYRGSSAITVLCSTLSSEIGTGLALSLSDVVTLCNSDPSASTTLVTSARGYLLESLPVLAQVEVGLGDRSLLRSYPSLSWRLANLLSSLDTDCLASISVRLAQWWAYDEMDAGELEMKKHGYLNFLLEVLLETSRWVNFDNPESWQLMTIGCKISSNEIELPSIGMKPLSQEPIAVSVEDSARGLLNAIQTEPLLALAGIGPNGPGDSEGSSQMATDSSKLASGAQRVLLAVLPLLKGSFDPCGLFLHAFDARNWPVCASILELEHCPVEAETMRLCGVLALLQPRVPPRDFFLVLSGTWNDCDATTTLSKMTTASTQKGVAQTTPQLPDGINMEECSSFMLKLLDNRSADGMDNSVASVVLAKVCCLWQYLQFPVKVLLHHLSARIDTSPTLCAALGKALYPQLDKQNAGNRRYTYGSVEERQFKAVKSLPFDQTVRLKVLSHVWGGAGRTIPLKDDVAVQSTSTSRILAEYIQMEGRTGHSSIPAIMLLKPSPEAQQLHQDRPRRRGDFQHTAEDVVAFSCGHTMSRDQLIHNTLPVLPSFIDSCTKSLQTTSELLVQEYTKPVLGLSCPSCLIEALQKISQLDTQSISNWMLG